MGVGNISHLGIFLEGMFSFLSPCVLPPNGLRKTIQGT
jgi:cytochrome c biogenesis protein CcdA